MSPSATSLCGRKLLAYEALCYIQSAVYTLDCLLGLNETRQYTTTWSMRYRQQLGGLQVGVTRVYQWETKKSVNIILSPHSMLRLCRQKS